MVSLETRYEYINHLKQNAGLSRILDFIFKNISSNENSGDFQNPDNAIIQLMTAVTENKPEKFEAVVSSYEKKIPDFSSPWINNDYLIFLFILVSEKFKRDVGWLKLAIAKRRVIDNEQNIVAEYFNAVINKTNDYSLVISPLLISFYYLSDIEKIDNLNLNKCIGQLNSVNFPPFENDFLNILYIKAFDVAFKLKDIKNIKLEQRYKKFSIKFVGSIDRVSTVIVYILLLLTLLLIYILLKYLFLNVTESTRNIVITVVGIVDVTILEIFKTKGYLKQIIIIRLKHFLGFDIIEEIE